MRRLLVLAGLLLGWFGSAAAVEAQVRHEIGFPDLPGYVTVVADLHTHTVFSDGAVWPPVRVDEAWRQGIDALAITDHIEYLPHREDVIPNHNRPYELAIGRARERNILFPRGTEITRDTPPGHFNAIFLDDVDPLDTPEFLDAIEAAADQDAFIFWNHPGWQGPERGSWRDVHTTMLENGWLHGIEVCNGASYYPEAHAWCLEKGLTMLGTSDIHAPDTREKSTPENHRTMTLVFATERSLEGLREALFAGRTAVWYQDQLIGREELLAPFLEACVEIGEPHHRAGNHVFIAVCNRAPMNLRLERVEGPGPASLTLPAQTTTLVRIPAGEGATVEGTYRVTNFLVAPGEGLVVPVSVPVGQ